MIKELINAAACSLFSWIFYALSALEASGGQDFRSNVLWLVAFLLSFKAGWHIAEAIAPTPRPRITPEQWYIILKRIDNKKEGEK